MISSETVACVFHERADLDTSSGDPFGCLRDGIACAVGLLALATSALGDVSPVSERANTGVDATPSLSPPPYLDDQLTEIVIRAPEPRYVAPTRRDDIGRIWAPVYINGKGPFRLVLDTGASRSGVTANVAAALGLPPDTKSSVLLRGVTGTATVPTIPVNSLTVGDLLLTDRRLPIVTNALGGAEGTATKDWRTSASSSISATI